MLKQSPDAVKSVHLDFLRAGCNIITTCSYQASLDGFLREGFSREEAQQLILSSVELAHSAIKQYQNENGSSTSLSVAVSLGCYGAYLADGSEYSGNYGKTCSKNDLKKFHSERIQLFLQRSNEFDVFLFETIPCAEEVDAILEVLSEMAMIKPTWISFSCKNTEHLVDGCSKVTDVVEKCIRNTQIHAVGVNCIPPQYAVDLVKSIRCVMDKMDSKKRIICYPNRGEQWDPNGKSWVTGTGLQLESFVQLMTECIRQGASIVGGCCRIEPAFIAALSRQLHDVEEQCEPC